MCEIEVKVISECEDGIEDDLFGDYYIRECEILIYDRWKGVIIGEVMYKCWW